MPKKTAKTPKATGRKLPKVKCAPAFDILDAAARDKLCQKYNIKSEDMHLV